MVFPKFFSTIIGLVPLLALIVTYLARFIEKQNKLQKSKHLIDLLKTRDELKNLYLEKEKEGTTPHVLARIKELMIEIEKEIYAKPKELKFNLKPYFILITIEIITVIGGVYSGILVFMNTIITGKSWQNNLPFLEGIFESETMRVILIFVFVAVSFGLTIFYAEKKEEKYENKVGFNLYMLLVFNILFLALSLIVSLLLYLLDFLSPWF
jgi:hypothetical protein